MHTIQVSVPGAVRSVCISRDTFLTGDDHCNVVVWSIATGVEQWRATIESKRRGGLGFPLMSPCCKTLLYDHYYDMFFSCPICGEHSVPLIFSKIKIKIVFTSNSLYSQRTTLYDTSRTTDLSIRQGRT